MLPLARLLVARGVPYAQAEESLKTAMVEAARDAHPDGLPHRLVSRIATTTGINRREVTRLTRLDSAPAEPQRSSAAQTFMRWRTNPDYLDAQGRPLDAAHARATRPASNRWRAASRRTCTRAACSTSCCAWAWPATTPRPTRSC